MESKERTGLLPETCQALRACLATGGAEDRGSYHYE